MKELNQQKILTQLDLVSEVIKKNNKIIIIIIIVSIKNIKNKLKKLILNKILTIIIITVLIKWLLAIAIL